MCTSVFPECMMCTMCMSDANGDEKRASDVELEFTGGCKLYVDSGN